MKTHYALLRRSRIVATSLVATGLLASHAAKADDLPVPGEWSPKTELPAREPTGALSFALRAGYAVPEGTLMNSGPNAQLSNMYSGMVPLRFDAGYKWQRRLFFGGYFQYGVGFPNAGAEPLHAVCANSYVECSANNIQAGLMVEASLLPHSQLNPWVGVGAGYESANMRGLLLVESGGVTYRGWDFLNLEAGLDIRLFEALKVAPYVNFTMGEYDSCNYVGAVGAVLPQFWKTASKTTHEWLSFGVRWAFDVGL